MKTIILSLFLAVMGSVAVAGIDTSIPAEHQVILTGDWVPTPSQTDQALKAVQRYLANSKGHGRRQTEIENILINSSMFYVQFKGAIDKNRKIIQCNFFRANGDESFPHWKVEEVVVLDGGFWYWRIDYDVQQDECLHFTPNGYS